MTESIKAEKPAGRTTGRRDFLGRLLGAWVAVNALPVLYVVARYILPPKAAEVLMQKINAGKLSEIPIGAAKIVKYNKEPVVVVHEQDGSLKAFSARCTHLGCVVEWHGESSEFHCNCHDSIFDRDGRHVSGPARQPLPAFSVKVDNDDITVEAPASVFAKSTPKS